MAILLSMTPKKNDVHAGRQDNPEEKGILSAVPSGLVVI
jgi:hypothetical protein